MKKGFLSAKKEPKQATCGYSTVPSVLPDTADLKDITSKDVWCHALLEARQTSAARRLVSSPGNAALARCCEAEEKAKRKALEILQDFDSNKGRPPIEAFLSLLCAGIEDSGLMAKVNKALSESLGKFGAMLLDVGALDENSLLFTDFSICDQLEVLLFQEGQAAKWSTLPMDYSLAMAQLPTTAPKFARILSGAAWSSTVPFEEEMWPAICHGDWLELSNNLPTQTPLPARDVQYGHDWPAVRCSPELLHGTLPEISFEEALSRVRSAPALVRGAKMLRGAVGRWSLDFFMDNVPEAGSASASRFSVYRAPEPRRRFRYSASEADGEQKYVMESEECAEKLMLDFHEFARRKKNAAGGAGDGFAYYLWGVVLRRTAGGFEGFNLGAAVDQDLAEEETWEQLRQVQQAGGWGDFEQAQIFMGCRDALTPCHYDLLHNAYVQVSGWKRFLLMDPCYAYDLYPYPQGHPMDRCARADLEAPDFQSFPRLRGVRAIEAMLGPGDVLILPCGWYHHVQSLTEDSLSVSFWFGQGAPRVGPEISPLNSSQRLLLCREVEAVLLLVSAQGLCQSYKTMRKLLQEHGLESLDGDPQEVFCCSWILWRVYKATGLAGRKLLWALADHARFDGLKFDAKDGWWLEGG